jgi:arginyl-tRNA synthetase
MNQDPIKYVLDRVTPSDSDKKMVQQLAKKSLQDSNVSIHDRINKLFAASLCSMEEQAGSKFNGSPFFMRCKKASQSALKDENQVPFDYQIDAGTSFQIFAKNRDKFKSPMDVARGLVENLPSNDFKIEVAEKNPFINITMSTNLMASSLSALLKLGIPKPLVAKKKIAIDYSSPNVAKDMHVGHLRSSVIGDSLSRVLEFCGHEVVRLNHVGDWGMFSVCVVRSTKLLWFAHLHNSLTHSPKTHTLKRYTIWNADCVPQKKTSRFLFKSSKHYRSYKTV